MALMSRTKVAFMLVWKSHTTGLPNVSFFEAWKNLKVQYEPVNVEIVQDNIDKYNKCQLEEVRETYVWLRYVQEYDWLMNTIEVQAEVEVELPTPRGQLYFVELGLFYCLACQHKLPRTFPVRYTYKNK